MPQPLPLVSVNHIARLTKRLEESRTFYRDVLGFRELPRPDFSFPGAWLYRLGLQIHLIVNDQVGDPTGTIDTRDNHLAFHVEDVAPVERLLAEHRVPFRVNEQTGTGVRQVFFRDPDGHHVEVATYPPTPGLA